MEVGAAGAEANTEFIVWWCADRGAVIRGSLRAYWLCRIYCLGASARQPMSCSGRIPLPNRSEIESPVARSRRLAQLAPTR